MKKSFQTFIIMLLISASIVAQTPQAFKYQAIARDDMGNVISDQYISLRITILQGSAIGTPVYIETHIVHTNSFGLANIDIGNGNGIGDFSAIDWGNDIFFIKTEMDPSGGNSFVLMGISQLLSVPYALHAENTTNVNDADADTTNELQSLNKLGNLILLNKGGGSVIDAVIDNDADSTNELQKIFKIGNIVFLSDSGGSFIDEVNDLDPSPLNEIQHLSILGNELSITSGNTVTLPGGDLPAGTTGQTLRNSGGNWIACSNLYNNGNKIGIGTTSPVHKMDILGSGKTNLRISSTNHSSGLELVRTGSSYKDYKFLNEDDLLGIYSDTSDFLTTSYKRIMSITNEGMVGIGVSYPAFKLHVKNVSGTAIYSVSEPDTSCAVFAASNKGIGVIAEHNDTSYSNPSIQAINYGAGAALYAEAASASGEAIYARAASSSGINRAIYGLTESNDGYAGYFEGGKNYFEGNVGIGTTSSPFSLNIRSTSANRSIYIYNRYSGLEDKVGIYNVLNSDGTSDKYGLYSQVEGNQSGNNSLYGVYTYTNDNSSTSNTYGLYSHMTATGTGDHYAIFASTNDGWAGYFEGGKNYFEGMVGIGTNDPNEKLHVAGNVLCNELEAETGNYLGKAVYAKATGLSANYAIYASASDNYSYAGYFEGGRNYFEGNVGIGTETPSYTSLDILNTSNPKALEVENQYNGYSTKYGIISTVSSTGTGNRYGIMADVDANPSDNSPTYGAYITAKDNDNDGDVNGLTVVLTTSGSGDHRAIYTEVSDGWAAYMNSGDLFVRDNVYIGNSTGASGYKVAIDGKVMCEELKVQSSTAWPDYVFDNHYTLTPLEELERSVIKNKHLPGVPSSQTINKEGITLGKMSQIQMEKIEELTLYIIELNKKIKKLEGEVVDLKEMKKY